MNNNLFEECTNKKTVKNGFYRNVFKSIFINPYIIISTLVLCIVFFVGFYFSITLDQELLTSVNFENAFIKPCIKYPFGTNEFGQNMFHIILVGTYNTLKLSVIATFINILFGVVIGIIWGNSNKFSSIMIFIKGIFDSIPKVFLFIIVIFALGSNFISLLIVVILFNWINIACLVRNNLILIRNKDYITASKLNKTPLFKIAIYNYLPNLLPIIFNSIAISIPEIIALELTIFCFKFSVVTSSLSLGSIVYSSISKNIYFIYPYLFLIPFAVLFVVNTSFFIIGKTISYLFTKEGEK